MATSDVKKARAALCPPIVVDLCSGMGGISLAAEELGMQVVAGVDTASTANLTYEKNFPNATSINGSVRSGNVIDLCIKEIRKNRIGRQPSIVVSGPPCQGFSIAGPRDPNDPRNQILLAVVRAIVLIKPKCALIENVARVLDENHSGRLRKLERTLNESGFHVQEIVLDAKDFGVPQRRRRAFFLITRRRITVDDITKEFEKRKKDAVYVSDVLDDLPEPPVRPDGYTEDCENSIVTNHFAMQHSEQVKRKIAAIPQGSGPMSYRKLHPDRVSNTLISGHRAPPAHYSQPRSITVREALRLQGFPDDFQVFGPFGSQMTQVTNAVPPPLAKVALEVLCSLAGIEL